MKFNSRVLFIFWLNNLICWKIRENSKFVFRENMWWIDRYIFSNCQVYRKLNVVKTFLWIEGCKNSNDTSKRLRSIGLSAICKNFWSFWQSIHCPAFVKKFPFVKRCWNIYLIAWLNLSEWNLSFLAFWNSHCSVPFFFKRNKIQKN